MKRRCRMLPDTPTLVRTERSSMDTAGLPCVRARVIAYLSLWPRPTVRFSKPPKARGRRTTLQLDIFIPAPTRRKPSALYFDCACCARQCGPLEAGCEDDSGTQWCRECTKQLWGDRDASFLPQSVAKFSACTIRRAQDRK